MANSTLGLIFEIAAHPEKAEQAIKEFRDSTKESLGEVRESMAHTQSASQELTNFIKSHLIFSVDEFIRLGREAIDAAKSAAEFGEEIHNLSEATGIGAEQLSGLEFAFKQTGASSDALNRGLREMARNLSPFASSGSEAAKAFAALGLSVNDANGHMKNEFELILELADAFHKMKDSTEKSAAASAILGTRVAEQWIPLLDRGRAGILAMISAANNLHVTLTDKDAKSLEEMNEQLKLVDARMEGVKLRISESILPVFVELANILTLNKNQWKLWYLGIDVALHTVDFELAKLASHIPFIGKTFKKEMDDDAQAILDLQTQAAMIQQHWDDMLKMFEGGEKGGAIPNFFGAGAKAAKAFSDSLGHALEREKEELQSFRDGIQPALRQIDLAYQRQIDSAHKMIEADRQLLAHKKITLAQEKREEEEYTDFLATAIQLRNAKWDEELRKTEANIQKISEHIATAQRKAHEKLGKELATSAPQGPQADIFGAQASGVNEIVTGSMKAVPAVMKIATALSTLNDALVDTSTSMQKMSGEAGIAIQFQQKFGDAMAANVAQAIVYGQSIGKAMESALKATLASIAAQAWVKAIYETAVGFADLFVDPPAAAAAFESAAIFASVGGAAAAIGAVIPGGGGGGGRSHHLAGGGAGGRYSCGESGGSGSSGQQLVPGGNLPAAPKNGNLTISIMGDQEAGQWLANTLNTVVQQGGAQLTATRTTAIPNPVA